jgi:predicted HTH transcriptional regulator
LSRYIQSLIDQGESQILDFKFEISDARKIARTLVAFSNTDGGKLLIGVKDNGKIAGVRSEEEYHMLEAAAELYCRPVVPFTIQKWTILGKTILEVDIAKSAKRPFLAQNEHDRWMAYLRVADQNILANRVMMKVWRKEKRKKGIFLEYSHAEKLLLNYLKANDDITLSRFCRLGRLRVKQAEEILSDLIVLEVIQIRISEKGARYSLISQI